MFISRWMDFSSSKRACQPSLLSWETAFPFSRRESIYAQMLSLHWARNFQLTTALPSTFWKMRYPWHRQQCVLMSTTCCSMRQSGKGRGRVYWDFSSGNNYVLDDSVWRKRKLKWLVWGIKVRTSSPSHNLRLNRSLNKFHERVPCFDPCLQYSKWTFNLMCISYDIFVV